MFGVIIVIAFILLANYRYKGTNYYQNILKRENRILDSGSIPSNLQIINVGSAFARFAYAYSGIGLVAFNFAQSPQSLSYDYRIIKQFANRCEKGCKVLINLPPCIFLFEDYTDDLKNAKYYNFLEPQYILNYNKWKGALYNNFPILFAGKDALHIFIDNKKENDVDQVVSQYKDKNSASVQAENQVKGWSKEFGLQNCVDDVIPEHRQEIINIVGKKLEEIVLYCKEHQLEPVLVATPFSDALNDKLGVKFMEKVYYSNIRPLEKMGVVFLDYRKHPDFQKRYEWFINGTCWLTKAGREHFMQILKADLKL